MSETRPDANPAGAPDVLADLRGDDAALWRLLGVLEDERSAADGAFVDEAVRRARVAAPPRRAASPALRWASGALAAALAIALLRVVLPGDGDAAPIEPVDSGGAIVAAGEAGELAELFTGLSAADVLALEVADAEVHDAEWFGG